MVVVGPPVVGGVVAVVELLEPVGVVVVLPPPPPLLLPPLPPVWPMETVRVALADCPLPLAWRTMVTLSSEQSTAMALDPLADTVRYGRPSTVRSTDVAPWVVQLTLA